MSGSQKGAAALPERIPITLTINGKALRVEVLPWTVLLDLLRDDLGLTGPKKGCDHGPLQQAFIDHDAFQCGYCTPGQICSGVALIEEGRAQTRDEIRELMSGNLCRCGAYTNIVDAIEQVIGSKAEAKS
jgi:xanthine dehydrogenase YagT iron-sulfur-binding subunit